MTRFACVLADPPWAFADQASRLAPSHNGRHYETMALEQIADLGVFVRAQSAPDAFLWLWCPNALVLDGTAARVCRAWGYQAKQLIPWVKTDARGKPRLGGGHYTRVCTEQLVLARRGRPRVLRRDVPGVIHAPRTRHSAKPDASYSLIEALCDGPRLELFARRRYSDDWQTWGDEAPQPLTGDPT